MKSAFRRYAFLVAASLQFLSLADVAAELSGVAVDTPAAPGSLSPHLAAGGNGSLVMSWLEPHDGGYALRFSRWRDTAWQAPTTVARGNNWFINWADFPSVVPITEEFWVAHWLVRRPAGGYAYDIFVAVSNDGGATWGDGFRLHDDNTDTEHGFVSIYANGADAGLIWLDGRNTPEKNRGMTLRAATLDADGSLRDTQEIDGLVCDCCQTDAVSIDDGVIVAYRDRTDDEIRDISVTRKQDGHWSASESVGTDNWQISGCPVNGPALAKNDTNYALAWFTAANDKPKIKLLHSRGDGEAFDAPVTVIDGDTLGHVGLVLLEDGAAVVSALVRASGEPARLTLTRIDVAGQQYDPVEVAGGVEPRSVPQLVLHNDALFSAWTIRANGITQVVAARTPIATMPIKTKIRIELD